MMDRQRVVLRFVDGRLIKGHLNEFSPKAESVLIEEESGATQRFGMDVLKAIFFVRTFEGNKTRHEKKSFEKENPPGKRVFVKFKDGESMVGYVEGEVPWEKGFFLEPAKGKGFFLIPVDDESNNAKVFVIAQSVWEVTVMG
jgi:small nuclear ribonucleoprotein (snRNP)-like protein